MDTSQPKELLLELLYGELTPEQEEEVRQAIHDDEELAEQWLLLQSDHSEVAPHIPPLEDIDLDIRDTILAAAAKGIGNASRRRQNDDATIVNGFWSQLITSPNFRAGASVAIILMGSAFVLALLYESPLTADSSPASVVVETGSEVEVVPQQAAMPEMAPMAADAPEEAVEEGEDSAELYAFGPDPTDSGDSGMSAGIAGSDRFQEVTRSEARQEAPETDYQTPPPPQESHDDRAVEVSEEDSDDTRITGQGIGGRASPERAAPSLRARSAEPRAAPRPEPESHPDSAPETDLMDKANSDDLHAIGRAESDTESDADTEIDREDSPDQTTGPKLLTQALQAYDDGDAELANRRLNQLFDDELHEELNDDQLRQAVELQESLEAEVPQPPDSNIQSR